ncbi:MAG TPA: hypothetical protein VNT26_14205, partial [Candidatus Sulfotelmatobacter sp.]|nr:hypothetical protein [Candidatus Sulfotelmatobacter sp.]
QRLMAERTMNEYNQGQAVERQRLEAKAAMERAQAMMQGEYNRAMAVQKAEQDRQIALENERQANDDVKAVEARNERRGRLYAQASKFGFKVDPDKSPDENEQSAQGVLDKANVDSLKKLVGERKGVMSEIDSLLTQKQVESSDVSKALVSDPTISKMLNDTQRKQLAAGTALEDVGLSKSKLAEAQMIAQATREKLQAAADKEAQMRAGAKLRELQGRHDELGLLIGQSIKQIPPWQLGDALDIPEAPKAIAGGLKGWNPGGGMGTTAKPNAAMPALGAPAAATQSAYQPDPTVVISGDVPAGGRPTPVNLPINPVSGTSAQQWFVDRKNEQSRFSRPEEEKILRTLGAQLAARDGLQSNDPRLQIGSSIFSYRPETPYYRALQGGEMIGVTQKKVMDTLNSLPPDEQMALYRKALGVAPDQVIAPRAVVQPSGPWVAPSPRFWTQ